MVTDKGLARLLSGAPELHRLCISGSSALTLNGVAEAVQCGGRQLLDLDMRDCAHLTRIETAALRRTCEATAPLLACFNNRLLHESKACVGEALMGEEGVLHRREWSTATFRRCSLRRTGHIAVVQPLYHCLTCAIVGQVALCSVCATSCHRACGHSVIFYCNAPGTCDCVVQTTRTLQGGASAGLGGGIPRGCQCLWGAEEIYAE